MPPKSCLIADDLDHRTRYLNIRNTILTLMKFGAVPIINENDTVSVEELQTTFGDNDRLAAMVTNLIRAPLLVLLSDVEGLYDGDPNDPQSQIVPTVTQLDESIWSLVRDRATGLSKGGMASKLEAARARHRRRRERDHRQRQAAGQLDADSGGRGGRHPVRRPRRIDLVVEAVDRLHRPAARQADSRRRRPAGRRIQGNEPAGHRDRGLRGAFRKGDVVALCDRQGTEFARGLTNYAADDVRRIKGLKTDQIAAALGQCPYEEVIHRDNLATGLGHPRRDNVCQTNDSRMRN